ncbi:MAG: Lpg1974 family pore-forming outer membrane protein [Gemmatales bacterium]|nr:Lpg1974 family pore-forming outer membrane protein [Gemmatales bacterium]MDW8388128.1 Lpg1974 family pore-forming outer membrane protein [Gemmatales bacterium]
MSKGLRSTIFTAALAAASALPSFAWGQHKEAAPAPIIMHEDKGPCCAAEPSCGPGVTLFGYADWLYWRAHRNTSPFAGVGQFLTSPDISEGSFVISAVDSKLDWDSGFRLGIGARMGALEAGFQYTRFDTNGSTSLGNLADPSAFIHANLVDRSFADDVVDELLDSGLANAASQLISLDYNVYDIWVGTEFRTCDFLVLRPFIGIRIADIDQDETVRYTAFADDGVADYDLFRSTNFRGYGLRGGLGAESTLWGITLFGRTAVSLLYSEIDTLRRDAITFEGDDTIYLRQWGHNFNDITPVIEVAAGVSYCFGPVSIAAGYEFTRWFSILQHPDVPGWDDIDGTVGNYRRDRGDLSLDGFFLRVGISY